MAMQAFRFAEGWIDRLPDLRLAAVSFLVLTGLTRFIIKRIILGRSTDQKDVPEPPAWPVIGHLHLLGKLPHQVLMKLARRYGPLMSLKLGALRLIVASDAQMAEEFLRTQDAVWASRPPTLFSEIFFYNYSDEVLQPQNELWRKMKKIYASELLSTTSVERQKGQRHESVVRLVNSLLACHRENEIVDVYASVANMNFDLMTKLMFGKRASVESKGERKSLPQIMHEVANIDFISVGECFPFLRWLDLDGVEGRLKKLQVEFDTYVSELLEERRRQLLEGNEDDESRDFSRALLSMLDREDGSGLTYDNIKAAIGDLYFAGIETITALVTFTIAEVMKHRDIKRKLMKELDDVVGRERLVSESDLVSLYYLKMVIKESLRLHPPVPLLIPHLSIAPSVVAGYQIPANTLLLVNVYAIQRDPELWEDPLAFKPERFSQSSIDARGQHFKLLPFGSGRRQCLGMNTGLTTTEILLARLFQSFDISLSPGMKPEELDTSEKTGAAIKPATPLRLLMSPRLPQELYTM